jgi:hypothetical protein
LVSRSSFGSKAQVCDKRRRRRPRPRRAPGNPADAARLEPAIKRVIKRTGRKPRTVAADRGYGEQAVDDALHEARIRDVVIPRKGDPFAFSPCVPLPGRPFRAENEACGLPVTRTWGMPTPAAPSNDRAYQGQPDTPIQEIVDFVLEGQGVVFADDGFLDESGQRLTFAEDAGRPQVVHHLKPRLAEPDLSDGARGTISCGPAGTRSTTAQLT